ncbi:transcriptional adapter 2-beta-like [Tropilaelaps mercedesae]|uniref:Transcriptional adapter 2-beta-like n=1 Tax=Tropilaelaps mercedesae TaxID=418985 RepID=A0A1V9WZY3_9ACAR|nr:transcriptional adapter 2-beta-like [Tropilaelaps mercedesae]
MPGPSGGSGSRGAASCSPGGGSPSGGQIAEHKCLYCTSDIRGLRVRCTQPACGPTFNLCSECFACQVELGTHRRTHPYEIIDDGNFPLFNERSAWRAVEESQLLDSVERFGFGNWEDIKTLLSGRSVDEVKMHYDQFYIDGNIGKVTWGQCGPPSHNVIDRSLPPGEPLSPSLNSPTKPPQELSVNDQLEMGYMPNRDDFEKEFDNDAENLISQLALCEDEDSTDREAKMALIDSYARRLSERVRRKKIAREHNLLGLFIKGGALPGCRGVKASSREGRMRREASDKLRPFLQDMSGEELETFMGNLENQMDLKGRIKDLLRARKNGLTRLEDLFDFEQAKKRRDKLLHRRTVQLSQGGADATVGFARSSETLATTSGSSGFPRACSGSDHHEQLATLEGLGALGVLVGHSTSSGSSQYSDFSGTTSDVSEWSGGGGGPGPRKPNRRRTSVVSRDRKGFRRRQRQTNGIDSSGGHGISAAHSTGTSSNKLKHHRKCRHFNRTGFPKSKPKARICSSLGLTAGAYMHYKIVLLQQARSGLREIGIPSGLDATRTRALLEHFYRAGWVK